MIGVDHCQHAAFWTWAGSMVGGFFGAEMFLKIPDMPGVDTHPWWALALFVALGSSGFAVFAYKRAVSGPHGEDGTSR
jgi:hypothetical protein